MTEYTILRYEGLPILLEIDNTAVFHPPQEVSFKLPNYPEYIEGILNPSGNSISVLIDLGKMLSLKPEKGVPEVILEFAKDENLSIKIPLPEVVEFDVDERSIFPGRVHLPSAEYYMESETTYLVIRTAKLYQTITKDIKKVNLEIPEIKPTGLIDLAENFRVPVGVEVAGSSYSKKASLLRIGEYRFLIEEVYIKEIFPASKDLAIHPSKVEWIKGLYRYEDDSIVAIDSANYFEIEAEAQMDIVIEKNGKTFMLSTDSAESVEIDDYRKVFTKDYLGSYLFSNLYLDEEGVIFYLNIEAITSDIMDLEKSDVGVLAIKNFFSGERRVTEKKEVLQELKSTESMEFINLVVGGVNCFLKNTQIARIGSPNSFDIPTINLGEVLNVESDPKYSVVANIDNGQFALLCDDITTTPAIRTELPEEVISAITPELRRMGFKELVEDGTNVGLVFDAKDLSSYTEIGSGKLNEEELEFEMGESNYGIWFTEYETLLKVWDGEKYRFFSTENLDGFTVESDSNVENPLKVEGTRTILVKIGERVIKIPRGSMLVNIQKNDITEVKGKRGFDLDGDYTTIEDIGVL